MSQTNSNVLIVELDYLCFHLFFCFFSEFPFECRLCENLMLLSFPLFAWTTYQIKTDLMASLISFIWKSDKFKELMNLMIFSSWVQVSSIWIRLARPTTLSGMLSGKAYLVYFGLFFVIPLTSPMKQLPEALSLTYYTKMTYVPLDLVEKCHIL